MSDMGYKRGQKGLDDQEYHPPGYKAEGYLYERPTGFRKSVRKQVWDRAVEESKQAGTGGKVYSPGGGEIKEGTPWDMGHKPGWEFIKHQKSAERRGIDRSVFITEYNNPDHYRPELKKDNRSHLYEGPKGLDYWQQDFG